MSAYDHGWLDAERGIPLRNCPYFTFLEANAWRAGWRAFYNSFKHD